MHLIGIRNATVLTVFLNISVIIHNTDAFQGHLASCRSFLNTNLRRPNLTKVWKKRDRNTSSFDWYDDGDDKTDWDSFWKETNQRSEVDVPRRTRTFKGEQYEPVDDDFVSDGLPPTDRWGGRDMRPIQRLREGTSTDEILGREFGDAMIETSDGKRLYEDPALDLQDLEFAMSSEDSDDDDDDDEDVLFYDPLNDDDDESDSDDDDDDFLFGDDSSDDDEEFYLTDQEMEELNLKDAIEFGLSSKDLNMKITSKELNDFIKSGAVLDKTPADLFSYSMVCALSPTSFRSVKGSMGNWGVDFKLNIQDWEHTPADSQRSLEDVALFKARRLYEATGLPCISEATGFEVEGTPDGSRSRQNARYRFNRMGPHVDKIIDILGPTSDPNRATNFKTVVCYYDGELQLFEDGECECVIIFADQEKALISFSLAMTAMIEVLSVTFNMRFLPECMRTTASVMAANEDLKPMASTLLRERILRDARALPNQIIDVSAFMDSNVDVNLMEECAKELAERFLQYRPTKILTVATTGLVLALPMASELQVPVVYARKSRSIVMSDTYHVFYNSKTVGEGNELFLAKKHLDPEDRVLIVDDFLSGGACQDALLRIVAESGAEGIGVGVLVEKVYEAGRTYLSGHNIPVESLAKITSVDNGIIDVLEE